MKLLKAPILIVLMLTIYSNSLATPGVLISLPLPLSPPYLDLPLPIQIPSIILTSLQLSQVYIKSIQYKWQFTQNHIITNISNVKITFSWSYKSDKGQGVFQQTLYNLNFTYLLKKNANNRLQIDILQTKSKLGHSAVHLGGNVKQTVVIQVTNLILNHAAITFRKYIEKSLKDSLISIVNLLDKDLLIYCQKQNINNIQQNNIQENNKCVYINTTLVAPPIINTNKLVLQINAAPYITGQKSGQLSPQSALIIKNSSKIQLQMHKKLLDYTINKILKLISQKTLQFDISSISSVTDINSLTLSTVFPKMLQFTTPRNVFIQAQMPQINTIFNQASNLIQINGKTKIQVLTLNKQKSIKQQYLTQKCGLTFSAQIKIVYGWQSTNIRLNKVTLNNLQCSSHDIDSNYIKPSRILDVKDVLMTYLQTGANGSLNQKLITLIFKNIIAQLQGKIYSQSIVMDLILSNLSTNQQKNVKFQDL